MLLLSDDYNPIIQEDTVCCYDYLLPFVYRFEHLLTSMYKFRPEDGFTSALRLARFLNTELYEQSSNRYRWSYHIINNSQGKN